MAGRTIAKSIFLLLLPALTACSIGDVRRPPPDRASASPRPVTAPPAPRPVADVDEVRHVGVAVPQRYGPPTVEFVDADEAYALFGVCDDGSAAPACPALLFATRDGGRSWRPLRHPHPTGVNHQLYAARGRLVVGSDDSAWYASSDGGASFVRQPGTVPPPGLTGPPGRFQATDDGRVNRWDGRRLVPLRAQPGLPQLQDVAEAGDLLVAAGADGAGHPYAAISTDQGRNWQRTVVPAPDGAVGVLRPVGAPDGEAWLVGQRSDRMGFPALWRWLGRWQPVAADHHPDRVLSAVPVGAGRVAVTGPDGVGVVADGRYERVAWPLGPEHYLTLAADGTLVARAPDEIMLNVGPVGDRRWIRLVLARA
ncbi:beta propeller repeat protein [Micromonospora auratinigra]|uniref:Exo-alpha-sialidase n=1 Tax=Micromonospora auratinigra TaxID=261654 RepID=A0A1A9A241_9ACTN|nr:hypothetical protein [Micromonospora auratinigra]SBT50160.1 hypothetical protein GA0070611_4676 [Micromonospora auratinigra]